MSAVRNRFAKMHLATLTEFIMSPSLSTDQLEQSAISVTLAIIVSIQVTRLFAAQQDYDFPESAVNLLKLLTTLLIAIQR